MKKLRLFDSLKFVVAAIVCTLILNIAHADTSINSVIAYGKTEQSGTPTPTAPVPIMTNNGVLKVSPNLLDPSEFDKFASTRARWYYQDGYLLKAGKTYTFSTNYTGCTLYFMRKSDDTSLASTANRVSYTPTEDVLVYFRAYKTPSLEDGYNFRLEEGSTATTGVYVDGLTETIRDSAGHTATAQMLLGLNDTYRDEQNITTGAITRKVGVKVLDGSENWSKSSSRAGLFYSKLAFPNITVGDVLCTHMPYAENLTKGYIYSNNGELNFWTYFDDFTTVEDWKQYLAEQYAAGTPVIVVYPLNASAQMTESVATQSLTTAPVRQTAGSILGMPIEVVLGDGTREWVSEMITIATTKYNEEQFAPVKTDLSAAVNAVEYVVSNTMSQAQAIDTIATNKQTRPDESCPPFKKCLLVEDEQGVPHWYEIYDPINDFLRPILAAAALSGNQGAPIATTHTSGSDTIYDTYNGFFNGSGAFRKKYIDNNQSAADRPFGPTTLERCADDATRTTSKVDAGICYNTGGMFRELTEGADDDSGEWAVVYNGNEGGASLGITPGVVYGVAKCTSVGKHTTEITGDEQSGSEYWWPEKLNNYGTSNPTTLASLITEYPNSNVETVFNTLPNPVGTDEKPGYPRDNFMNCWCKMTAIGVPGSGENDDQRYANGTIMSVSGGWVFNLAFTSAASSCALSCARDCASTFQARAAFRRNVLTVR